MEAMYGQKDAGFFGYSHFTGGFAGWQGEPSSVRLAEYEAAQARPLTRFRFSVAEYVRVPFGNVNLLPIPDNVTDEEAVYLSDVLPTSYNCVVDTGVEEGDVVGVWG